MDPESKAGSIAKVDVAASKEAEEGPLFFCYTSPSDEGYFLSPWYKSNFEVDGVTYKCAGQYIVADMARTAGDEVSTERALIICDEGLDMSRKHFKRSWKQMERILGND